MPRIHHNPSMQLFWPHFCHTPAEGIRPISKKLIIVEPKAANLVALMAINWSSDLWLMASMKPSAKPPTGHAVKQAFGEAMLLAQRWSCGHSVDEVLLKDVAESLSLCEERPLDLFYRTCFHTLESSWTSAFSKGINWLHFHFDSGWVR